MWSIFGLTADSEADLLGHVSDLVNWIRQEVVCLQEVKGAERQQLKGDEHVAVVVKPVQHLHAVADGRRKAETDCIKQELELWFLTTHCLLSGSRSLILSSTLISSLAASLYFSRFLMIFRAIRDPPLCGKMLFTNNKYYFHISAHYLPRSEHCTTFPNVPSPKVSTISSVKQIDFKLKLDPLCANTSDWTEPTSVFEDVPSFVDQVPVLGVPLIVTCSHDASLETKTTKQVDTNQQQVETLRGPKRSSPFFQPPAKEGEASDLTLLNDKGHQLDLHLLPWEKNNHQTERLTTPACYKRAW